MDIGLYFGSFNPIHTGHLIIAQHFLNQTGLKQVWFVVTPQNPFKPSDTLLNEYHRLHLVRLAIGDNPGLKVSDAEFHLPKPSYTSVTLAYLEEKFPQTRFSLLLGSDSFQTLPNWHNSAFIRQNYPIYVYERPGFPPLPGSGITPGPSSDKGTTFLKAPYLDISASHIRRLLADRKPITYLVPLAVEAEIEKNNYYR
jgi:nicotinate-nucleotide adenylyltransferase